ncbi:hypothetical protein V8E52_005709 [Russula decolorans]
MTRSKRTSHTRHSTPARCIPRIHAHSSPTRNKFRYQRHPNLKRKHSAISHRPGNNPEDTYLSLLRSIQETENDDDASSDGTNSDASSEDQLEGWDEETTLVEMLGCPEYNEGQILQKLSRAFADASHGLREDMILGLGPVLKIIREVRPAPGRAFITGLLGFDDACKHFEENSYRNAELSAAYAKIEADIDELFERLQAAYNHLEEKRATFQKRVKEQTNKMRDITSTLPADMNTLLAKLEKKYTDMDNDDGRTTKTKGRERTLQGALAELRL